jgi:hypothetical protein
LAISISPPGILGILEINFRVKVRYLSTDAASKIRRINVCDMANTALTLNERIPELLKLIANGA